MEILFITLLIHDHKSKYCSDMIKKYLDKELVSTKTYNEDFESSTKYSIFDDIVLKVMLK